MKKAIFIAVLVGTCTTTYAQQETHNDSLPAWDNDWEQQLRWNRFLLKPQEKERSKWYKDDTRAVDLQVDPRMPVVLLPLDEMPFLVMKIPDDFPSDIPVVQLSQNPISPLHRPSVIVIPRKE